MKLSTRTRYGVRLMVALALNYGKNPVFLKDIAKGENISEKYCHNDCKPITIDHLDGQFCTVCKDGFFSIKSMKKINSTLADGKRDN